VEPQYKLAKHIKIAMLYLEDDDPVSADGFIKKASSLIAGSKDPVLELQYKTSYARIMDAKRRSMQALCSVLQPDHRQHKQHLFISFMCWSAPAGARPAT
jgi:hypothetical protein